MSAYFVSDRKLPQGKLSPIAQGLFGAYEQGAMYDPEITGTLFQDVAGTTPVTAVEQPVGLMLDLSGRGNHATQATTTKRPVLSRRVNLLVASENLLAAAWIPINGAVKVTDSRLQFAGDNTQAYQNVPMAPVVGTTYRFEAVLSGAGSMTLVMAFTGVVYEEWVQPITLSATPTLFVMERTIAQAGHTACNVSLSKGTGSATEVTVHQTSLRIATDAHLPYQRVNTATDYDADPAKFPAYLRFDGVDDALKTGNIDFTGTDKMTVWAGVTKSSDAGMQIIAELGETFGNVGSFALRGPTSAQANNFGAPINTGAIKEAFSGIASAPVSTVLSSVFDGVGDPSAYLRVGGVQTASGAGASGAAKFINRPIYIGARAGTSFYFSGRLYSLIVRGAQTPLSQIEATELYIKQKMRMP